MLEEIEKADKWHDQAHKSYGKIVNKLYQTHTAEQLSQMTGLHKSLFKRAIDRNSYASLKTICTNYLKHKKENNETQS